MIYGIGVDVTDLARIQAAQEKNSGFAVKILTPTELANYQQLDGRRAVSLPKNRTQRHLVLG